MGLHKIGGTRFNRSGSVQFLIDRLHLLMVAPIVGTTIASCKRTGNSTIAPTVALTIAPCKRVIRQYENECVRFFKMRIGLHRFLSHWSGLPIFGPYIVEIDAIATVCRRSYLEFSFAFFFIYRIFTLHIVGRIEKEISSEHTY